MRGPNTSAPPFDQPVYGLTDRIAALEAEVERLRGEVSCLDRIVEGQAKLMVCYRMGTQRGAGTAIDKVRKATEQLHAIRNAMEPASAGENQHTEGDASSDNQPSRP